MIRKNGFIILLLLGLFITLPLIELLLNETTPLSGQNEVPLRHSSTSQEAFPSLGSPSPMWDVTFGNDEGWAESWDIIQLQSGYLCAAGTFAYAEDSPEGDNPYFAIFHMPPDDTYFSMYEGGSWVNSSLSEAHSVVQTDEGYIALAGAIDWYDNKSKAYMEVLYYNASMAPNSWYNGSVSDTAWSIIEHYPKGLVLAGVTESFGVGRKDAWLLHTDPNRFCIGSFGRRTGLLWNRTYGGSEDDEARCVVHCSTGGFAIVGFTESYGLGGTDGWLIRTDADGNHLWDRTFGTVEDDELYSIIECQSGGYAMIGTSNYAQNPDMLSTMWVLRISELGSVRWQHFFGIPGGFCQGYDIVELTDGTFALAGSIEQGSFDMWLVRLAQDGTPLTFQAFGGSRDDVARSITAVSSGGFALAGYTESYGDGYRDVWVVRVPEDYPPAWQPFPSSQTVLLGNKFTYKLKVEDQSTIDQWWISNTAEFSISVNGYITSRALLDLGTYPLFVQVNDTWGNTASAVFYVHVVLPEPVPPVSLPFWMAHVVALIIVLVLAAPFFIYSYFKKREIK